MSGHYLTVDGMLSGTGIRDSVAGGYLDPEKLGLSSALVKEISVWLSRYEEAHYVQFKNVDQNTELDQGGKAICKRIQDELPESKIEYFSNAEMRKMPFG